MKKIIGFVCIIVMSLCLYAMDWPSPEAKLSGNFGRNISGSPLLGDEFIAEGPVFAAEDGELIFRRNTHDNAGRIPSTLGATLVLDHGDGILTVYSRVQDDERPLPDLVEKGDVIAFAGKSGWTKTEGFNFTVFDRKERRWVNPSLIITPMPDIRAPVIQSVRLRNDEGREIDLALDRSIRQGNWTIIVNATDSQNDSGERNLMPHKIESSVNGIETGMLTFETFSARDGVLMMYRNGMTPVSKIYKPFPAVETGEVWFSRGQANLEIIVADVSGNSRRAFYRLFIE
jgi:hypothetical protein